MDEIFTITTVNIIRPPDWALGMFVRTDTRCFGWMESYQEACDYITGPDQCVQECYWNYVVLERMPAGIHPRASQEVWFKWDNDKQRYIHIPKPEDVEGTIMFGMG